jgi:PTS system glucose-specific IIC component
MSKKNIQHFGEVSHAKIKQKGGFQEIIAKLSRGLMLPIAMLPIAGLFLGIGSTIVNTAGDNNALKIFGSVLQVPGGAIFSALPCLFAIAIAISFTKDSGTAGLSAFVG